MFNPACRHKTSSTAKIILFLQLKDMESKSVESSRKMSDDAFDQAFRPKGAVAFFVLLILLGMVIWFGIYFLMLSRI
jgi:hypothetical protein